MKVLIIEDSRYKLEDAIVVLKRHSITDYVHFESCAEALDFAIHGNHIKNFDFVILDLNFYMHRRLKGEWNPTTPFAGAKFLWQMLENELKTPVIVYSGEDNYMDALNSYLFPSFHEYADPHGKGPQVISYNQQKQQYEEDMESRRKKLLDLDFILGHAHSDLELDYFVTLFLNSVNSEE